MRRKRIVISIRGGLVSAVAVPSPQDYDVVIVDHDNEEQGENAAYYSSPISPRMLAYDTRKKLKAL